MTSAAISSSVAYASPSIQANLAPGKAEAGEGAPREHSVALSKEGRARAAASRNESSSGGPQAIDPMRVVLDRVLRAAPSEFLAALGTGEEKGKTA